MRRLLDFEPELARQKGEIPWARNRVTRFRPSGCRGVLVAHPGHPGWAAVRIHNPMAEEPADLMKKLDDLGELIARSQRLKQDASRMLKESSDLDLQIERALQASLESAKQ